MEKIRRSFLNSVFYADFGTALSLMLIYPFVHKYFRKGITRRALKG